ncbi:MAG: hypothetical protein QNJ88_06515 [Acidimicrobiia bacterium]|nr:hypothetical protein [Acidimicrobiia bacterium]
MATALLLAALGACGGDDAEPRAIPWSLDPCGLAPPQEVSAAFESSAVPETAPTGDECRYRVDGILLRVIVLSDSDTCDGTQRSIVALGNSTSPAVGGPNGVFLVEPSGDVLVCDPQVTYLLTADGRSAELLSLGGTLPSDRSN